MDFHFISFASSELLVSSMDEKVLILQNR